MGSGSALGHMALHYGPGDEQPARRMLELIGCTLVDNGPKPGSDGFCTVLIDQGSANYADNIMFLSRISDGQLKLEEAITAGLNAAPKGEDDAVAAYRDKTLASPEIISHIGIRYSSFAALEEAIGALEEAAKPGGELEGRIQVTKHIRLGLDPAIDERIAASPVFANDTQPAFADYWLQCFVRTDLCGFGILAFGHTFELDFVFEPFFVQPPKFG
jgi:hypothetical protein